MRAHTGTSVTDYKFTDQELDPESGLYNYDARLYDPVIGWFISPDSMVPYPFDPQSLNRYAYVLNNPLIYIDPSGHSIDPSTTDPFSDNDRESAREEGVADLCGDDSSGGDSSNDYSFDPYTGDTIALSPPINLADITVTRYPGALGLGHVGIGVNTTQTTGFYPAPDVSSFKVMTGQPVPGAMLPDTRTPLQSITIQTTPEQDQAVRDFVNNRTTNPGVYDLNERNCATTVRDALGVGGIDTPETLRPGTLMENLQQQFGGQQQ